LVLAYRKGRSKMFSQEIKKIDLDVNCSSRKYIVFWDCSGVTQASRRIRDPGGEGRSQERGRDCRGKGDSSSTEGGTMNLVLGTKRWAGTWRMSGRNTGGT
jgi:hypothetical protein